MNTTVKSFLTEAHRRIKNGDRHEKSKPILQKWVGLGTAAAYRPMLKLGLMRFHDYKTPPPRCMGWLCLTVKGLKQLRILQKEQKAHLKSVCEEKSLENQYMLAGGLVSR